MVTGAATFPEVLRAAPGALDLHAVAGTYAFYDDGWPGRLLVARRGPDVEATLRSYRFGADYPAVVRVGGHGPHHVEVVVPGFNELPEQVFSGWFFGDGAKGFAGVTDWKGQEFGFFARRTRPHDLYRRSGTRSPNAGDGPEPVDARSAAAIGPGAFAGSWAVCCHGSRATLELRDEPGRLAGTWSVAGQPYEVAVAGPDPGAPEHRLAFDVLGVAGLAAPPRFTGYLFTRPRNAVAGTVDVAGTPFGCYLTRVA